MRMLSILALVCSCLVSQSLRAADTKQQEAFFEAKIRPVLVKQCYECHSASSKEPKGGLLLDTREGIRRGGDSGHAVVPGELADSLILDALRHESFEMPPEEKLPDHVIADFEKWVRSGAHDPRDGKSVLIRREIDFEAARDFWSFRPITRQEPPKTADRSWGKSDIDAFILSELESKGIRPVRDADSETLARRIYFDLIGLPPSLEQLDSFRDAMAEDRDSAIESLVDQLLDSQQFGERWGRHWLDVVRFAESTGMERNATFTRAWHYRDYVIDALNDDVPFDRFIREQIAGDLLPYESPEQWKRQLIATGMLAMGPKSLNETKKEKFQMDVVDEQIDVVSRAFLGLTASCARCHDHKFDPIPQSEYYSLAGIFTSTETLYGTSRTNGNRNPGRLLSIEGDKVLPLAVGGGANAAKEEKKYRTQVKNFERQIANVERQLKGAKNEKAKKPLAKRLNEAKDNLRRAKARLRQATQPKDQISDDATLVMAVGEAGKIADTSLRIRGEPSEHGRVVPRGFLTIASLSEAPEVPKDASGRVELAEWITGTDNPLTARVAVNRVWQHLFGRGIVSTVNNFGANGDRPSHPLLLDHLADTFIADDWSVKKLVRRIMLSRTYQLSCDDSQDALAADPDNKLMWRMNQRRLEAEAIRDAMLMAAGQLDLNRPSVSPVEKMGEGIIGRNLKTDNIGKSDMARSVYLPIIRGGLPEILTLFDFPEPSIIGGARNVTTVPTQALYMMNNAMVIESASQLAGRVTRSSDDVKDRVRHAYRVTLSREATDREIDQAIQFVNEVQTMLREDPNHKPDDTEQTAWTGFCQSLFASSEFRYLN